MELRHRYLALCGLTVHLYTVHASISDLDACYDPGRTYMVAAPVRPPRSSDEIFFLNCIAELAVKPCRSSRSNTRGGFEKIP